MCRMGWPFGDSFVVILASKYVTFALINCFLFQVRPSRGLGRVPCRQWETTNPSIVAILWSLHGRQVVKVDRVRCEPRWCKAEFMPGGDSQFDNDCAHSFAFCLFFVLLRGFCTLSDLLRLGRENTELFNMEDQKGFSYLCDARLGESPGLLCVQMSNFLRFL